MSRVGLLRIGAETRLTNITRESISSTPHARPRTETKDIKKMCKRVLAPTYHAMPKVEASCGCQRAMECMLKTCGANQSGQCALRNTPMLDERPCDAYNLSGEFRVRADPLRLRALCGQFFKQRELIGLVLPLRDFLYPRLG